MNSKETKRILILSAILTAAAFAGCLFINKICAVICLVLGFLLILMFLIYIRRNYAALAKLNNYLSLVCSGNYTLDINENTEGEYSILKNNLYKVITILQTQKEALEKDKTYLADSLADISHQLKTPLTSMTVMTDLLKQENDEKKKREFLEITENQLDKINWLITNLLKISKLDADTAGFKKEPVSINAVISESLKPFLVTMDLKNISCENNCADFFFSADKGWTVEAVQNIIKNCIEHTGRNGRLKIYGKSTNIYNSLFIEDNGCGIAPEDLPHIFERFYHGKNSSKESAGIGLALAKTVIEKEKGTISVKSTPGEGTVFEIRFYKSIV